MVSIFWIHDATRTHTIKLLLTDNQQTVLHGRHTGVRHLRAAVWVPHGPAGAGGQSEMALLLLVGGQGQGQALKNTHLNRPWSGSPSSPVSGPISCREQDRHRVSFGARHGGPVSSAERSASWPAPFIPPCWAFSSNSDCSKPSCASRARSSLLSSYFVIKISLTKFLPQTIVLFLLIGNRLILH